MGTPPHFERLVVGVSRLGRRGRGAFAGVVASVVGAGVLVAVPAAAAPPSWPVPAAPAAGRSTPVSTVPVRQPSKVGSDLNPQWTPPRQAWPVGGDGDVAVDRTATGASRSMKTSAGAG